MHTLEAMHQNMKISGANIIQIDTRKLRKEARRDQHRAGRVSDKPRWNKNHHHLLISDPIPKHARETRTGSLRVRVRVRVRVRRKVKVYHWL